MDLCRLAMSRMYKSCYTYLHRLDIKWHGVQRMQDEHLDIGGSFWDRNGSGQGILLQ